MNQRDDKQSGSIQDDQTTSIQDVQQLGLFAAIASLSYVFWVVGGMEMVERLAYYGVKAVAQLYAKDPVSKGGLGIGMDDFGWILFTWAFIQSIVPAFTGGLSDRYGYKITIFTSTVIKIIAYLIMATFHSYWGFFVGAVVLATGTGVFKPGIQGTLVKATTRRNSSMAWGVFYQTVNIGGFLGPLVAGLMRKWEWSYVFYACAGIICVNFLLLLVYKEVGIEERLERARLRREGKLAHQGLARESLRELVKPHVWTYLLIFSGFWFMFNALFDVLPGHIDDWVHTSDIVQTVFPEGNSDNPIVNFVVVTNEAGTEIEPEGLVNINAGMIMITCFLFAAISAKMRATTSMFIGTLLSSVALFAFGMTTMGWVCAGAIAIFSVGEMLSSPKSSEFIGNFAPKDKKAMYLGFSQIPLAIGWTIGGKLGPSMYQVYSSKDVFSRDLLLDGIKNGAFTLPVTEVLEGFTESELVECSVNELTTQFQTSPQAFVDGIPIGEAFDWLVSITNESPRALTDLMYNSHNIGLVWYVMGTVGIVSAFGIWIYGRWILTLKSID